MKKQTILLFGVLLTAISLFAASCAVSNMTRIETAAAQEKNDAAKSQKKTPVIMELFTSEGCSSCPPADKILTHFDRSQPVETAEIIVLSEHVDYWNRLGWTDPFSKAQFSHRQGEYSQFFGKNGDVYTPQAIVNGTRDFPGHNAAAAEKAIKEAAEEPAGDVFIEVGKVENRAASVNVKLENLPKITRKDNAIVLLAVTEDNISTAVERGENGGRNLAHSGVVRYLQNIGDAANDKNLTAKIVLERGWRMENLNVVAFVQETGSRKVLGAAKVRLQN